MKLSLKKFLLAATLPLVIGLAGCGGGGGASESTPPPTTTSPTASKIVMSTTNATVKTDNSNSATITATVMDSNNIAISGATVTFTNGTGQLGVSSGISSSTGAVTIPFTSGLSDKTNRTETITATVSGTQATAQIPIQVTGSTISVMASPSSVQAGAPVTLTASVKDAAPAGVSGQTVRFSIPSGNGSLSGGTGTSVSQTVTTGTDGTTSSVVFTPAVAGSVIVTAEWLNAAGNATVSATTSLTVTSAGTSFAVTSPASSPSSVQLNTSQAVVVSVPISISGTTVSSVRFSTTLGTWSNGSKIRAVTPSASTATETLSAGTSSGTANVQIDALDANGKVLATVNHVFMLSAPSAAAGVVTLQSSVSNVAPSTGGSSNSATLTATVRTTSGGSVVGSAAVLFEIMNPTGSGEQISPVVVITDDFGQAKTTFVSGSQSTVGGLKVKASIVDKATANCDNSSTHAAGYCDVKIVYVNATGVSVSLGAANVLRSVNNDADYELPMSVLVVDNAGAAVKNTLVSLSAFPVWYYTGGRDDKCAAVWDEDMNFPDIRGKIAEDLSSGVDSHRENANLDANEDINGNGELTPPQASAGSLPSTVTTDENGVATFSLIYHKTHADWVTTRVRAKVVVPTGTSESTNELTFVLPHLRSDAEPCSLPPSPANWPRTNTF